MAEGLDLVQPHQAEADETLWQHYCRVAKTLDVGELIATICEQMRDAPGDTPLSALLRVA